MITLLMYFPPERTFRCGRHQREFGTLQARSAEYVQYERLAKDDTACPNYRYLSLSHNFSTFLSLFARYISWKCKMVYTNKFFNVIKT